MDANGGPASEIVLRRPGITPTAERTARAIGTELTVHIGHERDDAIYTRLLR